MLKARMLILLGALTFAVGVMPLRAQDRAQAQAPASATAQGQLVRVDAKANTLVIKTAAGAEMQFRYTEMTKVTGASEGVSGLATQSGAEVMVRYTKGEQDNIATEIQVQQKK